MPTNTRRALLWAATALSLMGCTTYQSVSNPLIGWMGGYNETKGPGELVKVSYYGNQYYTEEQVSVYLLFRCAEIAKREGKSHFALYENLRAAVLDRRVSAKTIQSTYSMPMGSAYILLFDSAGTDLLPAGDVLDRLEPQIQKWGKRS